MASEGTQQKAGEMVQLVVFRVGDEEYGADIQYVTSVIDLHQHRITPVPRLPNYIVGVINLRGRVIPVIDLRQRLGLPKMEATKQSRIAVAEMDGGTVGMIVDSVSTTMRVGPADIEPPSPVVVSVEHDFVAGVARQQDRLVVMLDMERVLAREDRKVV